ncbi:mitochondrial ribosomal protein L32 [Megachile rotundata]|uniref:mitochondrial ribosomal protein L32 n=1 Tax=Megachile rotundata TaxID=143995 RepID=UPI000258E6B2|nr:PREDICTED: 39S ribosomal protein L32, mitochondrial [Megachile rotundata]
MANSLWNRLSQAFRTFDQAIDIIFGRGFPPGTLYAIDCNHAVRQSQPTNFPGQSLKDILNDAFLWAVPKHRRTIEKRLNRRFGVPKYHWKPHVPKTILTCYKCGHPHEIGLLCGYCYEIVKKETTEMQEAIQKELGLSPVEKDVIVLYEGEKEQLSEEFWKNQRIVELPKKRPEWFNQNLLQPMSQEQLEADEKSENEFLENIKNN